MSARPAAEAEVVGVVLAAGDGVRMGGSKALLLWDGVPLAVRHATRLLEGGCARVIVAVRPEVASALASAVAAMRRVRWAPSRALDPAGSLAVALAGETLSPAARVVITPVDAPPVSLETLRALTEALADEAADAVTPRYGDEGGHPVVCRAPVLSPYRPSATPPLPPLRDVLRALGPRRLRLPLPDPCIPLDLDTPADVLAVTGAPAAFLPR